MLKAITKSIQERILSGETGKELIQEKIDHVMTDRVREVTHKEHKMRFIAPNWVNDFRIDTFSTKEPETLEWIEQLEPEEVLWDIGANVGLYSIYAAKVRSIKVIAFEPSVFNLELLARNIYNNGLQKSISIIPIPLSDKKSISTFKMSNTHWGGALSTFGEDFDQNGENLDQVFEYQTFGISMDEIADAFNLPLPHQIKIDVDGIEHLILSGGKKVLQQVRSVLIEINDDFKDQAEKSNQFLKEAGLTLYKKCDLGTESQYNQWWVR